MPEAATKFRCVICPGWVISINDGQRHFITSTQLVRLYMLRTGEFMVAGTDEHRQYLHELAHGRCDHLPELRPRRDGEYEAAIDAARAQC